MDGRIEPATMANRMGVIYTLKMTDVLYVPLMRIKVAFNESEIFSMLVKDIEKAMVYFQSMNV